MYLFDMRLHSVTTAHVGCSVAKRTAKPAGDSVPLIDKGLTLLYCSAVIAGILFVDVGHSYWPIRRCEYTISCAASSPSSRAPNASILATISGVGTSSTPA